MTWRLRSGGDHKRPKWGNTGSKFKSGTEGNWQPPSPPPPIMHSAETDSQLGCELYKEEASLFLWVSMHPPRVSLCIELQFALICYQSFVLPQEIAWVNTFISFGNSGHLKVKDDSTWSSWVLLRRWSCWDERESWRQLSWSQPVIMLIPLHVLGFQPKTMNDLLLMCHWI